jgi:integrase
LLDFIAFLRNSAGDPVVHKFCTNHMIDSPKTFELEQRTFRDGHVVLYKRPNLKNPKWQCRVSVPNAPGYVRRTTGHSDEFEARRFAEELYEDLREQVRNGGALQKPKFETIFAQFEERYRNEAVSDRRYNEVIDTMSRYGMPFFKGKTVDSINNATMQEFINWRRGNGKRANVTSPATLNKDLGSLKVFFDWIYRNGFIDRPIEFDKPKSKLARRTHFDAKDWSKLTRFLREWVKQGRTGRGGGKVRDRILLTNYLLILANTGIRVGEARMLRWRDVSTDKDRSGSPIVILAVKGKTGEREVIARNFAVKDYFDRIRAIREPEIGRKVRADEFVFCSREGEAIGSFKKGFQNLISTAGVEFDSYGRRRTIYSLRHTYATFRLREGTHHFHLAQNMGTSVKMLEEYYGHVRSRDVAEELTKTSSRSKTPRPKSS